jgi:hypothetical protein
MRRRTKALAEGAAVAVVAFVFLVPAFYWFTAYHAFAWPTRIPIFTAYRSLGCVLFGFGDAYYTGDATFSTNGQSQTTQGLVFTCQYPILPL